jgi:hypothetical protein
MFFLRKYAKGSSYAPALPSGAGTAAGGGRKRKATEAVDPISPTSVDSASDAYVEDVRQMEPVAPGRELTVHCARPFPQGFHFFLRKYANVPTVLTKHSGRKAFPGCARDGRGTETQAPLPLSVSYGDGLPPASRHCPCW